MQELPFVRVRDLPPSASFYSAITQPLGLRYISASSSSIVFGDTSSPDHQPVFEVRSGADAQPPRPARLILSAHSATVVSAFHAAALRANPDLKTSGKGDSNFLRIDNGPSPSASGEGRASVEDFDGNIMEVVYVNPPDYPSHYDGSTVRRTQSGSHEVSRILDWNFDVATSNPPSRSVAGSAAGASAAPSRAGTTRGADLEPYTILRRSITTSTVETSPRQTSNGPSTSSVVSTVLGAVAVGAAVGGALTYSMMRGERERAPRQEFDVPPTIQRRSTDPDYHPDHCPRYVEVERTVKKIHYPEQYPPSSRRYPPPTYVASYSKAGGPTRSRTMEDYDDRASQHQSHYTTGSRARRQSEAGSTRRPLMITDAEHRSSAGSKHSASPKLLMETEYRSDAGSRQSESMSKFFPEGDQRSHAPSRYSAAPSRHTAAPSRHTAAPSRHTEAPSRQPTEADYRSYVSSKHTPPRRPEVETYVSARTGRTASTVRPAPPLVPAETMPTTTSRFKPPSRHPTAPVKMPATRSRRVDYMAARHMSLPGSEVGSSHANWDDDNASVAPSDSISCIGSKHGRRSHR